MTEEEVLASISFFFPLLIFHWQVLILQVPECTWFMILWKIAYNLFLSLAIQRLAKI